MLQTNRDVNVTRDNNRRQFKNQYTIFRFLTVFQVVISNRLISHKTNSELCKTISFSLVSPYRRKILIQTYKI